ncbi:MAG: hypothetical protein IIX91_02430 [Clostridia bacterium]|nr:hypothetical protein [Clostridia bacterium]
MAIVQDAFFIPDDIATGLATGIYRRIGSVVRYAVGPNKGQIVKHLKPIDLKAAEQAQGLGAKALQFVQQHKKGVTITVVCAAAIGAGWWGYTQWKNHEPKVLTDFRVALKKYVDAIRNGNMDIGKINALVIALEALKQHKHYDKISIQLTAEDLEVLVGRIYEYTVKLAEDNHVELDDTEKCLNKGVIIDLESYLKTQQRIFKVAA